MRDRRGVEERLALTDLGNEIGEERGELGEFAAHRQRHRLRPARRAAGESEAIGRIELAIDRAGGLRSRSSAIAELDEPIAISTSSP